MPRASQIIHSIRLKNFKAFHDTGTLPLKPITLLVGKNSAGKSSLIKAILGASQTSRQEKPDDSYFRLIGDYANLGTYTDTVHGNDMDKNFSIEFGLEDRSSSNRLYHFEYTFSKNERSALGTSLKSIKIHHDNKLLVRSGKPLSNPKKDISAVLHNGIELSYPKVNDIEIFKSEENDDYTAMFNRMAEFISAEIEKEGMESEKDIEMKNQITISGFSIYLRKVSKDPKTPMLPSPRNEFFPYIGNSERLSYQLNRHLSGSIYLSGLRAEPSREARLAQSSGNRIGIKGEDLATMLHQRRNNKEFMNRFNDHLQSLGIAEKATTAASYMKVEGKEVETGFIKILLQKDGKNRTLMDLGFGASQVLPVVFELGLRKKRLLILEQPELHLHPAAQSEIGSLLKFSIEQGNQILVETHSANLIERLKRLIREGKLDKDDVNIIYIGKDDQHGGSRCDVIGFDEKGEFTETWPEESFFGERELEYLNW